MSCIFAFDSNKYMEVISNLQLLQVVQNEKIWNFRVSILDSTHQQILQLEQQANDDQENLKYIIQLEEGDYQYLIYDQHIKLDPPNGGIGLCIIKSSEELMKILDSATAIDTKPKKEIRGKGIEFEHSDFVVKIGEFKKNAKQTVLLFYLFYKPYLHLPFEIFLQTQNQKSVYEKLYSGYMRKLVEMLSFEEGIAYQQQMEQIIHQLWIFKREKDDRTTDAMKEPGRKDIEDRKILSHNK